MKRSEDGFATKSCETLLTYAEKLYSNFADAPLLALGCGDTTLLDGHAVTLPLKELLARLESYVAEACGKETE